MENIQIKNNLKLSTPDKNTTKHFIVVGAGGTGGYVIPQLARMIEVSSLGQQFKVSPDTLTIIDNDIIESKNLSRQNFVRQDLGKNKAEVMQRRYSRAFNFNITYIPSYIEDIEQLTKYMLELPSLNANIVLIDCTDNNKTRILLHHVVEEYVKTRKAQEIYQEVFYISSGNEEMHGQTSLSVKYTSDLKNDDITKRIDDMDFMEAFSTPYKFELPDICEIFPDMEVGKLPNEESCAEQSVSSPQNIHTNYTAATNILGFLNKIINNMPIEQFLIFFNIISGESTSFKINTNDLNRAFNFTENNPYAESYIKRKTIKKKDSVFIPSFKELQAQRLKEIEKENKEKEKKLLKLEKESEKVLKKDSKEKKISKKIAVLDKNLNPTVKEIIQESVESPF